MRKALIVAVAVVSIALLFGCNSDQDSPDTVDTGKVTPEFLRSHGFRQSDPNRSIFTLPHVRLADISRTLRFPLSALRHTPSQPVDSDVRIVKIRDLYFVVESEVRDKDGRVISGSLDDPNAICTVSVSLNQVPLEQEMPKGMIVQPSAGGDAEERAPQP
jgi:hypothetical protein